MNKQHPKALTNIDKEVIVVKHKSLKRCGDSIYRSQCPVCEDGILLVYRDQKTFELLDVDRCVLCGQKFRYKDIDYLK